MNVAAEEETFTSSDPDWEREAKRYMLHNDRPARQLRDGDKFPWAGRLREVKSIKRKQGAFTIVTKDGAVFDGDDERLQSLSIYRPRNIFRVAWSSS